jgi:ABC-type uncharacterized transport system YnjBCD permease subunit
MQFCIHSKSIVVLSKLVSVKIPNFQSEVIKRIINNIDWLIDLVHVFFLTAKIYIFFITISHNIKFIKIAVNFTNCKFSLKQLRKASYSVGKNCCLIKSSENFLFWVDLTTIFVKNRSMHMCICIMTLEIFIKSI